MQSHVETDTVQSLRHIHFNNFPVEKKTKILELYIENAFSIQTQ